MLIRQFSIRFLLKVTAVCAFLSLFFHYAWAGEAWAIGLVIALVALAVLFVVQGFAFLILWSIASSIDSVSSTSSPFASGSGGRTKALNRVAKSAESAEAASAPIQAEVIEPEEDSE